jgi:hypothetical protein
MFLFSLAPFNVDLIIKIKAAMNTKIIATILTILDV